MKELRIWKTLRSSVKPLLHDRRGSMLTLAGISMTAVMGFTSMGLDIAMWYTEKRATQNIADAAAIAATYAKQEGGDEAAMYSAALAEAIPTGFRS